MRLIYYPEVLLFFGKVCSVFMHFPIPALVTVTVETSLFNWRIFINNNFQFLVNAKSATSQVFQSHVY
jgi:hypothetical protein